MKKNARRLAREHALQSLYAWQLAGDDATEDLAALAEEESPPGDQPFAAGLLRGVRGREEELRGLIAPHLDRPFERLSPVERAILYIGAFELAAHPETPFKVVLNEAVELGKSFGGAEGHRFVNGVLEKVAAALRPEEFRRAQKTA